MHPVHIILGKFMHSVSLPLCSPALCVPVLSIDPIITKEEMPWVYATGIVAVMEYMPAFRDWCFQ